MKRKTVFYRLLMPLLLVALTGCCASRSAADRDQGQSELHGKWYLQSLINDEWSERYDGRQSHITFDPSGKYEVVDEYGDTMLGRYQVDPEDKTIKFVDDRGWVLFRYRLVESVLFLHLYQANHPGHEGEVPVEEIAEFSRSRKGNARHRAIQELRHAGPLKSMLLRSDNNMRSIAEVIMEERERSGGTMPHSLGVLVQEGKLEFEQLLAPWETSKLPEDFERLSAEKQR